jgi:hypothetical protein
MIFSSFSSFLIAIPLFSPPPNTKQYNIFNNCPSDINLYTGGVLDGNIASGGNVTRFLDTGKALFYTDANGGNTNGAGTTRAGFFGNDLYYMVKDMAHINTGLQIKPADRSFNMAFCPTIECNDLACSQVFSQQPTRFPAPAATRPAPPYFRCPFGNTIYDITFCPTGTFPPPPVRAPLPGALHPNGNARKCLDVRGAIFENGTPVQIYDCNQTPAQQWFIRRGSTKVRVAWTNFCLDAGSTPADGVGLKIWECFDNLPAQEWFYTDDFRIALEGWGLCTDLPDGDLTNGNQVETWKCTDFNANQIWTLAALLD